MYIPKVTGEELVELLLDYDSHKNIYPEAIDSRLLSRSDNVVRGFLRLKKEQVLTVVLNTEHEAEILHPTPEHWFISSRSTRITEVKDPGEPEERDLPVGTGRGFLWRLHAYWAIDQFEDGLMVCLRTLSLSRSIPWGLGWIIRPFVESIPREATQTTLEATREELAR
jgi:hypothetical protein